MRPSRCPLVATDPDGDTVTFSATGLPTGLTIAATTGVISGHARLHERRDAPGDGDGRLTAALATERQTFTWTVTNVNRAPVLTALADRTDAENATVSLPLVASDPDDGSADLQRDRAARAGLTIAPATGLISGTLSYASAGTHAVTVTVTDGDVSDRHARASRGRSPT